VFRVDSKVKGDIDGLIELRVGHFRKELKTFGDRIGLPKNDLSERGIVLLTWPTALLTFPLNFGLSHLNTPVVLALTNQLPHV